LSSESIHTYTAVAFGSEACLTTAVHRTRVAGTKVLQQREIDHLSEKLPLSLFSYTYFN